MNGPKPAAYQGSQADWDALLPGVAQALMGIYGTPQEIAAAKAPTGKQYLPPGYQIGTDGRLYDYTGSRSGPGQDAQPVGFDPYEVFTMPGDNAPVTFDPTTGVRRATAAEIKLQGGGYGVSAGTRLSSDDPRYWANQQAQIDLGYAQLSQKDKNDVAQIAEQYAQLGMTQENARRQALMQFIQARDSLSANTANTSANVAKQIADYAASPRDTYAEAVYRNQVGGSTPFGDLQNQAFGDYGKALQQKGVNIFQNVAGDLDASRRYRDALPLQDWLPGGGSPAQLNMGASGGAPSQLNVAGDSMANANSAQQEVLRQMEGNRQMMSATPQQQAAIQQIAGQRAKGQYYGFDSPEAAMAMAKYFAAKQAASPAPQGPTTPPMGGLPSPTSGGTAPPSFIQQPTESGLLGPTVRPMPTNIGGTLPGGIPSKPVAYAEGTRRHPVRVSTGGIMGGGFDGGFASGGEIGVAPLTRFGGEQPSSSEGGLNLNIHELAHIVGQSGRVYASLGEGGYPEQVRITPTPSGKKAAQAAEKAGKSLSGTMKNNAATGGTASVDPSIDEMNDQYSKLLERLGGQGGGSSTPFAGARFLAGAPANALLNDPYLKGVTEARYSTLPSLGGAGLAPEDLWAQIKSFTPQGIVGNSPRVNFA